MEGRKSNASIGGGSSSSRNTTISSKRGGDIIRKGPWKEEEDEVLINHVKKYGPRDWSSIRSKGLLQRTGKSCRLRWVNKLRPNLKNGCKFSADEERIVIELQAIFGNKWARIATYLPGRTDNDVKNFWSSRQKRLARLLQSSASTSSSSSSHKSKNIKSELPHSPHLPLVPGLSMSSIEEIPTSKAQSSLQPYTNGLDNKNPPSLVDSARTTNLLETGSGLDQLDFPPLENFSTDSQDQPPFHQFPQPSQEFFAKFDESEFINVLETVDASELGGPELFPSAPPLLDSVGDLKSSGLGDDIGNPEVLDTSFDDFPTFMLDDIEPLPCPPKL